MEYSTLDCFNYQLYLLSLVGCLCFGFLNELVWLSYRALNVPSVSPTKVSFCWLSFLVTVAWYTTLSVRHFPRRGQDSF